uniref:CG057 n=1 Tax=Macrostomum lignano TaxID=282301 RepID=A0A1I8G4Y9_9PLAT
PYALVPPHPSMSADNVTCISGSRRSSSLVTSAAVVSKAPESGDGIDLGAAGPPVPARGGGVFATLRSGHNPLDSSASNPAIFNYSQDYPDDNRNTDPYNFESGYRSSRKIVYEVVV